MLQSKIENTIKGATAPIASERTLMEKAAHETPEQFTVMTPGGIQESFTFPVAQRRQMEEFQREVDRCGAEIKKLNPRIQYESLFVKVEAILSFSCLAFTPRVFRSSNPSLSLIGRWTEHVTLRRLTTPLCAMTIGCSIACAVAVPLEYRILTSLRAERETWAQQRDAALAKRKEIFASVTGS